MERKQNKRTFSYEPFIAGAILKFGSIDNVDFSMLAEDFEKKINVEFSGEWYAPPHKLRKYYNTKKNGTIALRDGISLDEYLQEDKCSLREKLRRIAGKEVLDYFNGINIKKYYDLKERTLLSNKKEVLERANVLLISDIPEEYEELKRYGFKNIDHFKSIVRADDYFSKHPEELQKYHIILKGRQRVQDCCFEGAVELDGKINELGNSTPRLETSLNRYNYPDYSDYVVYLYDIHNRRYWNTEEHSYTDIFDRIVENTLINHTLENVGQKEYIPVEDRVNPNRLPLPKKKEDLKILYLDKIRVSDYAQEVARRLGLNITFMEDNNMSLGRYVKRNLGDYDIIIASDMYSRNILGMADESTEQCKDSGRDLTLLVTYDDNTIVRFDEDYSLDLDGIGSAIDFNYAYGGNLAPDSTVHEKRFRVLRKHFDFIPQDENGTKYYENEVSCMTGIISAAVNVYNNALLESISDLDLDAADEFDAKYDFVDKRDEALKESLLEPIRRFDRIREEISNYLYYKRRKLIKESPEGLKITEGKYGIKVEDIYDGVRYCTITYPYNFRKEDLRVFDIQTLSKKGNLTNPETVGLYTRKYEGYSGIPKRPNKRQEKALSALEEKIDFALCPLNRAAWNRQHKKEEKCVTYQKTKEVA